MSDVILCFDCATFSPSMALYQGQKLLTAKAFHTSKGMAGFLVPEIIEMLSHQGATLQDIKKVFVCQGPGSFTGIRVGLSVAQALKIAGVPRVQSVSTFAMSVMHYQRHSQTLQETENTATTLLCVVASGRQELFAQSWCLKTGPTSKVINATPKAILADLDMKGPIMILGDAAHTFLPWVKKGHLDMMSYPKDIHDNVWQARPGAWDLLACEAMASNDLLPHYGRAPDAKPKSPHQG